MTSAINLFVSFLSLLAEPEKVKPKCPDCRYIRAWGCMAVLPVYPNCFIPREADE